MRGYNCRAACEVANTIPGWLAPDEAAFLYDVGFCSKGDILELGTYFGKSTYLMAQGIRDAGKPHRVLTVDIHSRGLDPQTNKLLILAEDSPVGVLRTLKTHGLEDVVIQMIGWTHRCVPLVNFETIHAVFIDAGHDYESCSQDFLAVRRHLLPNRTVQLLMHDNGPTFPGVQRTINELVRTDRRFRHVIDIISLFVCELVAEGECQTPERSSLHRAA
jgi:hypothetical protein